MSPRSAAIFDRKRALPAAGRLCSTDSRRADARTSPSRSGRRAARMMASCSHDPVLARRVSRLPRRLFTRSCGLAAAAAAPRAAGWSADHGTPRQGIKDVEFVGYEGVARILALHDRAQRETAGNSIGTSLAECTARSARPSASPVPVSFTNRPLPPIWRAKCRGFHLRVWTGRGVQPGNPDITRAAGRAHVGLPHWQAGFGAWR